MKADAIRFKLNGSEVAAAPGEMIIEAAALMQAPVWDQGTLDDLAQVMGDASICGLGQAAPNPIACVVKYFPQELA